MNTTMVAVQLDSTAATIYEATPPSEQAKIQLLFSILLREFAKSARTLEAIMNDVGEHAAKLGLTEEQVQAMLDAR